MVSFDRFQLEDGIPIYLQILVYLKRGIIAGTMTDGDELPSRRVLSALLGVNPNTVQKAYRMLEEEGLMVSRSGAKSCLALDAAAVARVRGELLERDGRGIVHTLRQMGLTKEEAIALIERYWNEVTP